MTISGINGGNLQAGQSGSAQAMDSYSRNIQKQIMDAQKQLQELSSNEKMSPEEKMKKRQELQQQINDLNMQLKQHQMEQRKEKQQKMGSTMDDLLGGPKRDTSGNKNSGLSQASMTAMISADSSMKQSKVQGSVATRMKDRASVLESEIKLDNIGGQGTSKKKEELADVEKKAMHATASQMNTLTDANRTLKEAAAADKKEERAEEDEKTESKPQDKTHVDICL